MNCGYALTSWPLAMCFTPTCSMPPLTVGVGPLCEVGVSVGYHRPDHSGAYELRSPDARAEQRAAQRPPTSINVRVTRSVPRSRSSASTQSPAASLHRRPHPPATATMPRCRSGTAGSRCRRNVVCSTICSSVSWRRCSAPAGFRTADRSTALIGGWHSVTVAGERRLLGSVIHVCCGHRPSTAAGSERDRTAAVELLTALAASTLHLRGDQVLA